MRIVKSLFARILSETKFTHERYFFAHVGVLPRLVSNWKKKEPESWGPWYRMLRAEGVEIPKPGVSTIEALGGYEAAKPIFLEHGYQYNQIREWHQEGDPRTIENLKKLLYTLNNLPDELRASKTTNAEKNIDSPKRVARR